MSSSAGEIANVLVNVLESAPVQSELVAAIGAGEVAIEDAVNTAINNIKVSGALGLIISATKGSIEAEITAAIKQYTPQQLAALLTSLAQNEAKAMGG